EPGRDDALLELVERGERAVLADLLDRAPARVADLLDSAEPEADAAVTVREAELGLIDVRRQDGDAPALCLPDGSCRLVVLDGHEPGEERPDTALEPRVLHRLCGVASRVSLVERVLREELDLVPQVTRLRLRD